MTKNNKKSDPLKIGIIAGLIPLTVGLMIFFIYWSARTYYAIDLKSILYYGLLWLLLSIMGSIVGLLLIASFIYKNYPIHRSRSIAGILLIVISYPCVVWIINVQDDINRRAYVEIHNATLEDRIEVMLKGTNLQENIGILDCGESEVICYYPEYLDGSKYVLSPYFIVAKCRDTIFELRMPPIDEGVCAHLIIDGDLTLRVLH